MKYCLIGETLGYSYSAEIHRLRGLDYTLCPVKKGALGDFLRDFQFDGFNVTIPYKREIFPFLDGVSDTARAVGAVNTVLRRNGKLYGDNTDVDGLAYALRRKGVSLGGKNVLVLGSGGAAQAARFLSEREGAKNVTLVSRTGKVNYGNCKTLCQGAQVLINATPVGTEKPNEKPMDLSGLDCLEAAFDCVYNPFETALVREAKARGLVCSGGISMLVEQALLSEDIWLRTSHTAAQTEEIVREIYRKKGEQE